MKLRTLTPASTDKRLSNHKETTMNARHLILAAGFAIVCLGLSLRADQIWDGESDTTFANNSNWVGDVAPANNLTGDMGIFSGAPTANQPNLTGTRSILGLDFQSAGWTLAASSGTLTVGVGGIDSAGAGSNLVSAPIAVGTAGGNWTVGTGNTLELTGLFSGSNGFTKDGEGTLRLAGTVASTQSGAVTVAAGVLEFNAVGVAALGGGTGRSIIVNDGATVRWGDDAVGQQIASTTAQFTVNSGGLVDLNDKDASFAFSGNERIRLYGGTVDSGTGTWTFTGNNATAAQVDGLTVSTIAGNVHFGGATIDRSVSVANSAAGLDFDWAANILAGDQLIISAPVAESGSEIRLGGANAFTGNITLNNGVTVYLDHADALGDPGTGGSSYNDITGNSTLVVRGGISYNETGNTRIQFSSLSIPGFRSLAGDNTWNGPITNPGGSSAMPGVIQVDADTLTMNGSLAAFSSNSRQLAKTGDGTLVYANANNFNATLYVDGGAFVFANSGQANVRSGNYVFNGGTLGSPDDLTMQLGTGNTQMRFGIHGGGWTADTVAVDVNVGSIATLVWGGVAVSQNPSVIRTGDVVTGFTSIYFGGTGYTGSETVTISGGGGSGASATLDVVDGVVVGLTLVDGGSGYTSNPTVSIGAPTSDGGTANFLANGAPLILNSEVATARVRLVDNLNLGAGSFTGQREIRVLDNPASDNDFAELGGIISNTTAGIGIAKTGAGRLLLSGNNSYDGDTTVTAGTLAVGHANALGSTGNINVANAAILVIESGVTFLRPVTFAAGATLAGTGTYSPAGGFTVSAGVHVAPGNSPGILNVGDITFDTGSFLDIELGGLLRGTEYDALVSSGTIAAGGTLNVVAIDGFSFSQGDSFDILDGDIVGLFEVVSLPALTGLKWNTDALYTDGIIRIAAIPEPASLALLGLGAALAGRRRRG